MALSTGDRLGPYEIVSPLGAGGMGEVYKAKDTRLDRTVAVKVLPSHLCNSAELRARLEREAKAISSLSHPHICVLHDIGQQDGVDFLVMEYMDGETLAARLERGPLPLAEVLRFGIEIGEALDRAHKSGIIHRDLKPGNVMLTKNGAKLMDFGLARATGPALTAGGSGGSMGNMTQTPTMAQPLTAEGTLVGTFQYMAPEQLEGKEPDSRTDLFAFGALLYEMATGRRAFAGNSQASLIASIMSSDPPSLTTLAPMSPQALDRLVRACLEKDPDDRIQTAHDVRLQLQWIRDAGSQAGAAAVPLTPRRRKSREGLAWTVAALAVIGAVAAGFLGRMTKSPVEGNPLRFSVTAPPGTTLWTDNSSSAISPDGRVLALIAADSAGTQRIWLRPLESLTAKILEGTENALNPFWSPDSRNIGFFADGKLKKIAVGGGSPEVLCDAPDNRGGAWSKDGVIVFAPVATGPLMRISAGGGEPAQLLAPDAAQKETALRAPEFLPDGKHFLFVSLPMRQGGFEVSIGSLDSKERKRLTNSGAAAIYAEPGFLLLVRNGRTVAQRFDPRRLELSGEPFPLGDASSNLGFDGGPAVSASTNGVLSHPAAGFPNTQLVWLDRAGNPQGMVPLPPGRYEGVSLSPDAQHAVVERRSSATAADLWMVELSRGLASRFTFTPSSRMGFAVWSPDGSHVAYCSDRAGPSDVYMKLANGAGEEEPLLQSSVQFKYPYGWSPDGKYVTIDQPDPTTGWDLWLLPMQGERKPVPFLRSLFNEYGGWISPDGRWIAYTSDESGKQELYVQSFPTPGSKYQVSTAGALGTAWSKNGKEMIIFALDGTLRSVDVETVPTFKVGTPRLLFKQRTDSPGLTSTADLQRFLATVPAGDAAPPSIAVEVDWQTALAPQGQR